MVTDVQKPETREYGFTVMVKEGGSITLEPHNLANDFEFAGLVEYVNQRKSDLMKTMGLSLEAKTLHSVGMLAKVLLASVQEAQGSDPQVG
jgi:hypothetical protein